MRKSSLEKRLDYKKHILSIIRKHFVLRMHYCHIKMPFTYPSPSRKQHLLIYNTLH